MIRWILLVAGVAVASPAAGQVTSYAFVPHVSDDVLTIIDTRTNTVVGVPVGVGASPYDAVPTPDGRRVYVANSQSGTVSVVDTSTRTLVATITVGGHPQGLDITPDGRKVYVPNAADDTVSVIDVASNTVPTTVAVGDRPTSIRITPDGARAWVTNAWADTISVLDTTSDSVVGSPMAVSTFPYYVTFSPNGRRAYVSHAAPNSVAVMNVASRMLEATLPMDANPAGSVVTRDGSTVLVALIDGSTVSVINAVSNTVGAPIAVEAQPTGIALTPDGRTAYVPNYGSSSVWAIDVASRTRSATIPVAAEPLARSPFVGPNIITSCSGCGSLNVANDAALDPLGFGRFVNFDAGTLRLTELWSTNRTLSILAGGGTIDTNGFNATVWGDVINDGTLVKTGTGFLDLRGVSRHTGGTTVLQGRLSVRGVHTGLVRVQGGELYGDGAIGSLFATSGFVGALSGNDADGTLAVTSATLAPEVDFRVVLMGPDIGTGYARLDAGSIALGNAELHVFPIDYRPFSGTTFTIITNATGTFAGLPEGALFGRNGVGFRITYHGGDGDDVVLTVDNPPTVSDVPNQSVGVGRTMGPLAFTVADDLLPVDSLVVTATSSNEALLPSAGIAIGGSGASRTLTATPVLGASGVTFITISVSNGRWTTQESFLLTVLPALTYYLSEGATGAFFSTDLLLANPNTSPVALAITFFKADGTTVEQNRTLPATSRTTVRVNDVAGLEAATSFSTLVTSLDGLPVMVERTMWWDAAGYGAHGEKASDAAASQWYFAEGAQGYFHTYFLLLNPNSVPTAAHVTYFLESGATVQRDYTLAATSRLTIDAGADTALVNQAFGARITFDLPGMAERAMYFGDAPQFTGGHAAAGVTAPSATWLLAEGATGPYFDAYVLIANPNDAPATITMTYLPLSGAPIVRTHTLTGRRRLTINIGEEDPALATAAVATSITSDQPIVAERAQYWPHGAWTEAHASAGETTPGTRWGFAEGRVGGASQAQTYVLIANSGTQASDITATFLRGDGTTIVKTFRVSPMSRFNIGVAGAGSQVPELADESFGVVIDATAPVIAERSLYTDADGVGWAAGTNVTGTRLP